MLIEIKVKPNSSFFKIIKSDKIVIQCRSKPEGNKANEEIIKELKKLTKREVKIVKGLKTKNKVIEIVGLSEEEFSRLIG
ncbi:MAG: DUF167 domain-containing protein [Candidatus Aenigmatarchaeota archaeon]